MARILIAGYGYIGSALGESLAAGGHQVVGLRRTSSTRDTPASTARGGIQLVKANVENPRGLARVAPIAECDHLVYCVGASAHDEDAYRRAYVDGLQNLIKTWIRHAENPTRLIFVSSTAVYGQTRGEWVDETSPANATHFSGRLTREGEAIALGADVPAVVLRLGGIYGPGRTRLINSVRAGSAAINDGPPRYLNLNHRDDCVGALKHLLFLPKPKRLYLGCDGHPEDRAVILQWIAAQLGLPPPRIVLEHRAEANRHGANKRCRNDRLLASGYTFRFPTYQNGYEALLNPIESAGS